MIAEPYFEKVTFEQFLSDVCNTFGMDSTDENTVNTIREIYESIELPKRATKGSAGYDFHSPFSFDLESVGSSICIPTGIRAIIPESEFLALFPRSGHGFKYRISLANTAGIIDSDYSHAKNEGHIMIKIIFNGIDESKYVPNFDSTDGRKYHLSITGSYKKFSKFQVNAGDSFAQGIFMNYYHVSEDNSNGERVGGFGSTGN